MLIRQLSAVLLSCSLFCSCGIGAENNLQQNRAETTSPRDSGDVGQKKGEAKQPRAAVDPNKFAIIVTSVGGEEVYTKKFTTQALALYEALTNRLGFFEKQVFLLTESGSSGPEDSNELEPRPSAAAAYPNSARATAQEVRSAFAQVKAAARPESLVLIVLIGHGSFDNQQAKFNLAGPDLTAKDYARLVAELPTRKVVFVNCASSSGEFIKPLSAEGRVVITATRSGNEQNVTVFADHFIAALTEPSADADKNGRISVLEAFNYATRLTADWYKQKDRLATEHALIDDNGDGVGHEEAGGGDGLIAKTTYLDSKPLEQAGTDAELARLITKRQQLEDAIEKLKSRKNEMKPEEYETELERLLVDLAKLNQEIKARQK